MSKRFLISACMLSACAVIGMSLAACSKPNNNPAANGAGGVHNLTPDEMRRAEIAAQSYFNKDFPAGADDQGNPAMKKGAFSSCRPQDSNSNWLVTCTGMVPKAKAYIEKTMFCGYGVGENAVMGCNDKDQK